jgi:hypothetical protein
MSGNQNMGSDDRISERDELGFRNREEDLTRGSDNNMGVVEHLKSWNR